MKTTREAIRQLRGLMSLSIYPKKEDHPKDYNEKGYPLVEG
jgi:hypothetical protein